MMAGMAKRRAPGGNRGAFRLRAFEQDAATHVVDARAVKEQLERALSAVSADDPVSAVGVCTGFALDHFVEDRRVGVWPQADGGLERVLGALRGILRRHWMPALAESALHGTIEATVAAGTPRADRPVLAPHPVLVHAPVRESELLALALSGEVGGTLANQSAWVRKELRELEAIVSQHRRSRRANLETWLGLAEDPKTYALRLDMTREEGEFCAAALRFEQLVRQALAVYPPFAVYDAAGTVLGTLGESFIVFEPRVFASGTIAGDRSSLRRAAVGVALARLGDAVDAAFPGAMPRGSAEQRRPRKQEAGPYRAHASGEHPKEAPAYELPEPVEAAFRALDGSNARAAVERGLTFVGLAPGLIAPEDLDRDARDLVERRQLWQRNARFWQLSDAGARAAHALRGQFAVELWRAVTDLAYALFALELGTTLELTRGTFEQQTVSTFFYGPSQVGVPAELHQLTGQVFARLGRLAEVVGASWGLRGDLDGLIDRLVERVDNRGDAPAFGPRPGKATLTFDEVCVLVARRLPASFADDLEAYRASSTEWERARRGRPQVVRRVNVWDHLDFLSTSIARDSRAASRVERETGEATARLALTLHGTLMHALAVYPPATVYFSLGRLLRTVQDIRIEMQPSRAEFDSDGRLRPVLLGREEAIQALFAWTAHAASVFGPILSPGEWLAEWLDHELRSQPSAPARGGES
jgi:hypothetical protein